MEARLSNFLNTLDLLVGIHHINVEAIHLKIVSRSLSDIAVSLIRRPVSRHDNRANLQRSAILSVDKKACHTVSITNLRHALLRGNSAGDALRGLCRNSSSNKGSTTDKNDDSRNNEDKNSNSIETSRTLNHSAEARVVSAHFRNLFLISGFLLDTHIIQKRSQ